MAVFYIFQLYDEISECYFSRLCDRDTLVSFAKDRIASHHNLLYPLGLHYGFNVQSFTHLLLHMKYCSKLPPDSVRIVPYDKLDKKKLMSYPFLNAQEKARIDHYGFTVEYKKPEC